MRSMALLAVGILIASGCGSPSHRSASVSASPAPTNSGPAPTPPSSPQLSATPSASSSPGASPSPGVSPGPGTPAAPCRSQAASYGLLLGYGATADRLVMVGPDGCTGPSVQFALPSLGDCGQGMGVFEAPPVSASNDKVYFRDGDTRIRSLTPAGATSDVTTVPGGRSTISFFSVSPDDARIAVVVEDFSNPSSFALQLYVEDLVGGGHHSVIYASTTARVSGVTTLWPMGWHAGNLVLAVVRPCTYEQVPAPNAWRVVSASSAAGLLTIGGDSCVPGWWPSPAGLACTDTTTMQVRVYNWSGQLTSTVPGNGGSPALSPDGSLVSTANGGGLGNPSPVTTIVHASGGIQLVTPGVMACLWIDNTSLLTPDAVFSYPGGDVVSEADGDCAGRFPGGL